MNSPLVLDLDELEPVAVECTETEVRVTIASGATISAPLWWYPRLFNATPDQRRKVTFSRWGMHWEEVDEDLSVSGLLRGAKAPGAVPPG